MTSASSAGHGYAHTTIVVLAKAPVAGLAKTRLCPPCTPQAAARFAEASLRDTAEVVESWGGPRLLSVDRCGTSFGLDGWRAVDQCAGDLGDRLDHTFELAFSDPIRASRLFLIGMDTPQVTVAHLADASAALERADVVIGPAVDGGYWGIGTNCYVHGLFDGVPMSTADTFTAQCTRAAELGQQVAVLDYLRDIDSFDDAMEIGRTMPERRVGRLVTSDLWWAEDD